MNVLFLHDEPWDSGIAHYALTLAAEMNARGHQVSFWGRPGSFAIQECRRLSIDFWEIKNPWLHLKSLRQKVKKRNFQIINAHTGSSQTLGWAIKGSTPLIRTRADARPASRHALSRFIAQKTNLLIAANTRIESELKTLAPATRVELIFQGISGPPDNFLMKIPEGGAIGVLGRLDPVKGHETLLQAAAILKGRYPQARFLAAGDAQGPRLQTLRERARELGLAENFTFLGRVENIWDFIARCQIGVVASENSEAVSRAALEWMSAGRAVIASRVGGLPDLIKNGENGLLVQPRDPAALADALDPLLGSFELVRAMGQKSRKRFEDFFSLQKFADRTEKVFLEIINRGSFLTKNATAYE